MFSYRSMESSNASGSRPRQSQSKTLVNQAIAQSLIPADANNITIALALISSGLVQSSLLANTIGFFGGGAQPPAYSQRQHNPEPFTEFERCTRSRYRLSYVWEIERLAVFALARVIRSLPQPTQVLPAGTSLAGCYGEWGKRTDLINQASSSVHNSTDSVQRSGVDVEGYSNNTKVRTSNDAASIVKIEALGTVALNNIPVLANGEYASTVTVGDGEHLCLPGSLLAHRIGCGEWAPGLSELPGFQTATANKTTETDSRRAGPVDYATCQCVIGATILRGRVSHMSNDFRLTIHRISKTCVVFYRLIHKLGHRYT